MSHDAEQSTRPAGRSINVQAFGDSADELELAALDEARTVFGKDMRLEIVRDYLINPVSSATKLFEKAGGKRYVSTIGVRVLEQP